MSKRPSRTYNLYSRTGKITEPCIDNREPMTTQEDLEFTELLVDLGLVVSQNSCALSVMMAEFNAIQGGYQ